MKKATVNDSLCDRIFYAVTNIVMGIIALIILYPMVYVVSSSFSSGEAVMSGKVILWPVDFSLDGYKMVFQYNTVINGYLNSILYTVLGSTINIVMTMLCAYPLARNTLPFRGFLMFLFAFTMYFSGGLIPSYLLVRNLNIMNTIWALLLPGAISVYNMIIARTFLQTNIPNELLEAAQIDGCNDFKFLFSVILPLSKAIIAVLTLYYAVAHWNAWFNAMIYLNDRNKYPLQLVLRDILIVNQLNSDNIADPELAQQLMKTAELLKYSLIVIATVPMMIIYPFVQKYFVRGVMIGSLKG